MTKSKLRPKTGLNLKKQQPLRPVNRPASQLRPVPREKAPSDEGAFSLDIADGDVLTFDGEHVSIRRGEQELSRCRWHQCDHDPLQLLQKDAGIPEGDRIQGSLVPGLERKEYSVKGGKATNNKGKSWNVAGKSEKNTTSSSKQGSSSSKPADGGSTVGTPRKSDDLPPGARWITMRPNNAEKGVPVLIQERPDGSAVVIGGAGGKLNQLHLKKLSTPEQWKQRSAERKAKREAKEKKRLESMTDEERQAEEQGLADIKEHHKTQRHENAIATIKALDEHGIGHGLTQEHMEALETPPAPDAEPEDVKRWQRLTREATQATQQIQQAYEHKLVTDHEARAAARFGDEGLSEDSGALIEGRDHIAADADGNDISSIHQLPDGRWLVRNANGEEADKVYETWMAAAKEHAGNVAQADADGMPSQPDQFYQPKEWVREHQDHTLPEGFEFKTTAAAAIADLSRARKDIGKSEKAAKRALREGNPFVPGADVGPVSNTDVSTIEALEQKAQVLEDAVTNSDLLGLVDMVDAKGLKKHLTFGGYAKLGEISSDVLKQNVLDPQIVDALGHNSAAQVLAYAMRQNMTDAEYDLTAISQGKEHAEMSRQVAQQAIEEAQPLIEQMTGLHDRLLALEAQKGDGDYTPDQLIEVDNLSYQAKVAHESLQKQLGTVVGQLQASAAMTLALESKGDSVRFGLKGDIADLIPGSFAATDAAEEPKPSIWDAYGLGPDDFEISDGPDGQLATIKESGLKKLVDNAYSEDDREAYETAISIKRGDFDEETFLPAGFAYRAKGTFTDLRAESEQFGVSFDVKAGMDEAQMQDAIRSYIGARVANGENPLSVRQDIFSPELYLNMGIDQATQEAAIAALNNLDKHLIDGNRVSDKAVVQAYQTLGDAEAAKQRKARKTDDLEVLHKQTIDHEVAVDAVHRSLAAFPMAKVALKSMADLSAKDRRWMREYAVTQVMGEELEEKRKLEKPDSTSDQEMQVDIFGNAIAASEVAAEQRGDGAELSQWQRFSKIMGGDAKAYAAVRDKLKGQFFNRFAGAYGAISGKPLLTGEQKLEHVDRLLLAQLPENQRQEMLDFIRSREQSDVARVRTRSGGKFAAEVDDEWLQKLQDIKGDNRQISLLQADTGTTDAIDWQRTSLGSTAEEQLAKALDQVLPNFEQINDGVGIYPELNWGGQFVAHQRGLKFLEQQKKIGCHFSAGCVHGSTLLTCEKTGITQSFYDWWSTGKKPWVKALDTEGSKAYALFAVLTPASAVFVKGYSMMYRVQMSNGRSIVITADHKFLSINTQDNKFEWVRLRDLSLGAAIAVDGTFGEDWSSIVKISAVGESPVFDITVPKYHNYLAHGIFNHNSGKSAFMLGAFSHLHSQGKVKKALIAVPSAIIGQMVGEAATFLSPSSGLTYNGNIGWSREQRIEAMRDDTAIHITTRESLSNDILHLVEKHTGVTPDQFQDTNARDEKARQALVHKGLTAEGIDPKDLMMAVDESHDISRRKGVQASKRSLALDALGYHSSYMIGSSGTPLKNDVSEIHDFLRKIDPDKYGDQAKFMAKYGQDTEASKRALQRLVGKHAYAVAVKPTTKDGQELSMKHEKPRVELSDYQKTQRSQVLSDYRVVQNWYNGELRKKMREIKNSGEDRLPSKADFAHVTENAEVMAAIGRLSSDKEMPEGADPGAIAGGKAMAAAALKNTALNRLYHRAPFEHNAKAQHCVNHVADLVQGGKPTVVFSASSEAAEMLRDEMGKRGLRVGYVHGGQNAEQKTAERLKFHPAQGDPQVDVLVCTDAAQTGLNLQRGKALIHYDVPLTQKAWDQRSARIFRRGQTEDVEVHTLMAAAPEEEQALARMQRKGKASRVFQGHDFSRGHAELIDDTGLAGRIERMRTMAA